MKLPKAEHDSEEWHEAMQAPILVPELDGLTMFVRIGMRRKPPTAVDLQTAYCAVPKPGQVVSSIGSALSAGGAFILEERR